MSSLYKKRQFLKQFIRLYESFPCLWNLKSSQYHDRDLRTEAYTVLVKKMQEIQPGADRTTVVKKINCLRSNLRKEKRKILEGIQSGRIVKPNLWYHHHFDFLNGICRKAETEAVRLEGVENIKIQDTTSVVQIKIEEGTSDPFESIADITDESQKGNFPQNLTTEDPCQPTKKKGLENIEIKDTTNVVQIKIEEGISDPLKSIADITDESHQDGNFTQYLTTEKPCQPRNEAVYLQISHPTKSVTDSNLQSVTENYRRQEADRHDVFGRNVSMKLRYISSKNDTQRIMAEKIINEALSLAEMELLTMEHCKLK